MNVREDGCRGTHQATGTEQGMERGPLPKEIIDNPARLDGNAPVVARGVETQDPQFRHLDPEVYWAGRVSTSDSAITPERLKGAIAAVAKEENVTFSGFLSRGPDGELRYEISRYPRRAFGPVPSIERCEENLSALVDGLKRHGITVEASPGERPSSPAFRMVLGLEEGYYEHERRKLCEKLENGTFGYQDMIATIRLFIQAGSGQSIFPFCLRDGEVSAEFKAALRDTSLAQRHSVEEVMKLTAGAVEIRPAEIVSAGPWGVYQEPAAVVSGSIDEVQIALHAAAAFHQERVAVEEFGPWGATTHMVELCDFCPDPDER